MKKITVLNKGKDVKAVASVMACCSGAPATPK